MRCVRGGISPSFALAPRWSGLSQRGMRFSLFLPAVLAVLIPCATVAADLRLPKIAGARPRNIIFILTDDHRHDCLGVAGHPWLETPHLDRLANGGVYFERAMVTTSLCSPSRASILTGLYAHTHRVVDNYNPVSPSLIFFPQHLQKAGYETAFIGKWHMGETDEPQRGFDHWVAFKGQGTYWPDGRGTTREVPQTTYDGFNVNGRRVPQQGYITDELTDYALDWLGARRSRKPFFLYVSHKAVHSDFVPADRHVGRYKDKPFPTPATMAGTPENRRDKPMWLQNQRNSRHGADFGYNLPDFDMAAYYKRYCESLLAVDDNVGRIVQWLEQRGELEHTLIVYMGDNGFQFGEHGLIDKRTAYEKSILVPLIFHCPDLFQRGTRVERTVANIDIAPTLLEVAGLKAPARLHGRSFLPLARGQDVPWRDYLLYEYYWEQNYPQTPTMHALVGDRWKYIRYHGLWDLHELYDVPADPHEQRNLIHSAGHQKLIAELNQKLFDVLDESAGNDMPLLRDRGKTFPWRHPQKAKQASFPPEFFKEREPK
jgi:N-acetylglucosamine-6-sulfatase